MIRKILGSIATPYSATESAYWLVKRIFGLSRRYPGIVNRLPRSCVLNKDVPPRYSIVFVGDIMPTAASKVRVVGDFKTFLRGSDYFVANFEGVLTRSRKRSPFLISDRRHETEVLDVLSDIFPPPRTFLCVANNHAADFGREEFKHSASLMQSRGFNVFGWSERPFIDILEQVRIISGTMWSNRFSDYVFGLKEASCCLKPCAFNILYPHFGYEFELYPRPAIVAQAKALIHKFDAIVGHHAHCPQPISVERVDGVQRLIAYSLGNFLGAFSAKKYQYGIVLKVRFGQDERENWGVADIQWHLTRCSRSSGEIYFVELADELAYRSLL